MNQLLSLANEPATWIGFSVGVVFGMGFLITLVVFALRHDASPRYTGGGIVPTKTTITDLPPEMLARIGRQDWSGARWWPRNNGPRASL